jgi:hypothetical protein
MEGAPHDARAQWQREQAARAAFGWFEPGPKGTSSEHLPPRQQAAAEAQVVSGDIAADTNGELVPRYEFVGQRAEQLVSGDLMLAPRFGPVRITWVAPMAEAPSEDDTLLQIRWVDAAGRQSAGLAVTPETPVVLRVPDRRDGAVVQRAIDRAHYFATTLEHRSARLIAAHLQHGPDSGLYSLAVSGEILPCVLEELAIIADSRRPYVSRWSRALYAYCHQRPSRGPLKTLGSPKP